LLDRFADGVWFVALAPVTNAGSIPAALAAALNIPVHGVLDLEAHVTH
jgi:predicted ATPase